MLTWILGVVFGLLAVPLALAVPQVWSAFLGGDHLRTFALGALGGGLATVVVIRKAPFLAVLEHELTHMVVALLHLRLPLSLNAGKEGGEVTYTGDSAFLIRLAPYVLPTFTIALLALSPAIASPHQTALRAAIGVTWGYHVVTTLEETRPNQPDLKTGGRVPAFLGVAGLGLLFYVGSALWAVDDFGLCRTWLERGVQTARHLVSGAVSLAVG